MGVKKEQCCKAIKQTYMLENYHSLPHIVLFFFYSARSNTSNTQNHSKERSCNLCESRSEAIRGVEAPSTAQSSKDNPLQLQKHDICHLRAENVSL